MYEEFTSITASEAEAYMQGTEDELIRKHIASYCAHGKILEVGCGRGIDAHLYDSKEYTGVDISPELIDCARRNNPKHTFTLMSASKLRFPDNYFNVVFCKSLLEHLPSELILGDVYSEMLRVSKGKVIIAWDAPPLQGAQKSIITKVKDCLGHQIYLNRFSFDAIQRMTPPDFCGKLEIRMVDKKELWIIRRA